MQATLTWILSKVRCHLADQACMLGFDNNNLFVVVVKALLHCVKILHIVVYVEWTCTVDMP